MIIDSHEHIMFPAKMQLDKMDESGVYKAVLFCIGPHLEKAGTLSELKAEMAALVQQRPKQSVEAVSILYFCFLFPKSGCFVVFALKNRNFLPIYDIGSECLYGFEVMDFGNSSCG